MSWVAVGMGGLGLYQGMQNEKRMKANDKFRKAAITYSPWTGMGDPGSQQLPGMLQSGLQGAATGAMIGNAMGKPTAPATTGATGTAGAGALGGNEMAAELGMMGKGMGAAPAATGTEVAFNQDPMQKWTLMQQPLRY